MKKYLAVILAAVMLLGGALAEGLTEYSDANYSFQYPADWIRDATQDGTVILKSPEGNAYVRADLLLMDLITLTGDETTDARFIQVLMKSFAGEGTDGTENNLVLDGSWELVTAGGLHGFRAPGTWKPTGEPAVLTVFTGGVSMASFLMVGETAAALEETLTSSLKLTDRTTESVDGMKTWESDKLRLCYPDTFKMLDIGQAGVIVFAEITESPSMINVMTSELPDTEYTDDYGLETMREVLKQAGEGLLGDAEIKTIGGRNVVAAEGSAGDTPGAVYVLGRGKTVVVLNFAGANAVSAAETVIASMEFK